MSFSEALDMGKYAPYVWGSFGVTFACMIAEVVWLSVRKRTISSRVSRIVRMATRQKHES